MPADGLTKAMSVQSFTQALKHMQLSLSSVGAASPKTSEVFASKTMQLPEAFAEAFQKAMISLASKVIEGAVNQGPMQQQQQQKEPVDACPPCVQVQVQQYFPFATAAAVAVGSGVLASGLTSFLSQKKTQVRDSSLQTVVTYRTDRFKFLGHRAADDMCAVKNDTTTVEDMNWCCRRRRRRRE